MQGVRILHLEKPMVVDLSRDSHPSPIHWITYCLSFFLAACQARPIRKMSHQWAARSWEEAAQTRPRAKD